MEVFSDFNSSVLLLHENTMIIMTSNIGSQYLLDGISAEGEIREAARDSVMRDLRGHFRPEFLNRIDEIVLFKPLMLSEIKRIVDLLLEDALDDEEVLETAVAEALRLEDLGHPPHRDLVDEEILPERLRREGGALLRLGAVGHGRARVHQLES